ncbi:DUF1868 domain-containing protein [Swaminathania salitolerans]|uniref:DUF1868 domain-containing protein n=1 Tax=Swaminathania salitolerans TaxID=182838 RepID=A0A511BLB3_9PROT|nr:hypothetical protein AA21291_0277 [Swaminathania salitolerans LMG 21291]GEL01136.1 hypothetical protein SSA02_02990 [Swaminathania salitolerans]
MSARFPLTHDPEFAGRRALIRLSGTAVVATVATAAAFSRGALASGDPSGPGTRLSQRKFYPDGRVRPYRGNTIICPLPRTGKDSVLFTEMEAFSQSMQRGPWAAAFAFLPPSSYHMTVFEGLSDGLRTEAGWPRALGRDASASFCDQWMAQELATFPYPVPASLRMMAAHMDPALDGRKMRVRLCPADRETEEALTHLREKIGRHLGMFDPARPPYVFHATIGYPITPMDERTKERCRERLLAWQDRLARHMPPIALGRPAFSVFDDMSAYRPVFALGAKRG